jgi:uncharacterized protein YceK
MKHLRLVAGVYAICALISGCATITAITTASVSPTQVIVAANAFDAIEATVTNYLTLPPCPTATLCRSSSAVAALVPAIRAGRAARNSLEGYMSANPGALVPVSGYNVLTTSITALRSAFTQYGITGG